MENCLGIIEDLKETRHGKVLEQQGLKFERLKLKKTLKQQSSNSGKNYLKKGHSNQVQTPSVPKKHWVINLSNNPLSETQETLLAHGPNLTVTPQTPHTRNS